MLVGVMARTTSEILTMTLSAIVLFGIVSGFHGERRAAGVRTAMELLDSKNRRHFGLAAAQPYTQAIDTMSARYRHNG